MPSSVYNKFAIVNTTLDSVTVDTDGTGFQVGDTIIFQAPDAGETATANVLTITGPGGIDTISGFFPGSGYTFTPTSVSFITEKGAGAVVSVDNLTINFAADGDILAQDIVITSGDCQNGGAGILRLYMSFDFDTATEATITVTRNGRTLGTLNADNGSLINDSGLYRFDIDIEPEDSINLQSDIAILEIFDMRAHMVIFGA